MIEISGRLALSENRVIPIVFGAVILAWSANWPVMKVAIDHIDPTWLAAVRFLITVLAVTLPVFALGRFRLPRRSELPLLLAVGTLQMAAFTFLSASALRYLPAGSASVVAYSTPLWVAPAAALILRERIGVGGVLATLFGLAGIAALAAPALLQNAQSVLFGVGMLLAASVAWSIVIIVARRAKPADDGLLMVSWQSIWACLLLVPAAIIIDGAPSFSGQLAGYVSIAFVGVFATALAFVGTLWLASRISALAMSIGMLSVPVLSILLSAILLQERPDTGTVIGLAAIMTGVAALKVSRPRSLRKVHGG